MYKKELSEALQCLINGTLGEIAFEVFKGSDSPRNREKLGKKVLREELEKNLIQKGMKSTAIRFSVSHTTRGNQSWVIMVGSEHYIGVDLEMKSRCVSQSILYRISSPAERKLISLGALGFWVLKEAAYKANPWNQGTVLPQYTLVEWQEEKTEGRIDFPPLKQGQKGSPQFCRVKLLEMEDWMIGLAYTSLEP